MKNWHYRFSLGVLLLLVVTILGAQPVVPYADVEPSRFDYGRMWTFEYAPKDYLKQTYDLDATDEWLEKARLGSLRLSNFCSASFISPDGLILTNHHCSRGEVGVVMGEDEDFDRYGFYAATLEEERRVESIFVKQLVRIADITDEVKAKEKAAKGDEAMLNARDEAIEAALTRYGNMPEWDGLEIEPVVYYNGEKISLYGYKRYDDVRLVLIPELQVAYFGGDYDNFTYPRYNLDFTLWRAYDENGQPVNSSDFYFPLNPDGIEEGTPVFVTGNPGSTERYRTVAQLEYDRDYRYSIQLDWLRNRSAILQKQFDETGDRDLQEMIFGINNGIKAIGGIVKGMHDPYLMGKKAAMEKQIKSQSKALAGGDDYWAQLEATYKALEDYAAESTLLVPSPISGKALLLAHYYNAYYNALKGGAGEEDLNALREQIGQIAEGLDDPYEVLYLSTLLGELQEYADENDSYVAEILDGKSPEEAAERMLSKTKFGKEKKLEKLMEKEPAKLDKDNDPLLEMARLLVPAYQEAAMQFRASAAEREALAARIGEEIYQVYGLNIPPDAGSTLRLADGRVQRYDYNGTLAPVKTTFYGMYDRYYSNDGAFPWSLPERWLDPPAEMLQLPLNIVSTCDIIGGNSGSPILNKDLELVGLVFDGNIESLPGNFIFDETVNRTVSVHSGGLVAAMKYIYKAERILEELKVK